MRDVIISVVLRGNTIVYNVNCSMLILRLTKKEKVD